MIVQPEEDFWGREERMGNKRRKVRFATTASKDTDPCAHVWGGDKETPDVQDAEIQADEEATKERNLSADIMKESRRVRKRDASRSSLVKMSLGLISPGM